MLIVVAFMVPSITYVIQPLLKKIFHAWLYPPARSK
jgi:antibiotic biosynthesis monooxygenase (ABM) superfamily enzyme